MDLVKANDNILRTACSKFDFGNPPTNPVELYKLLGNELIEKGGIGLAAPQLGLPYHFFVIHSDPVMGFFNAKIVDVSEEQIELEEGCLSFPGITLKITRPRVIRVRFADPLGNITTQKFQDMTARVIQHELDHCEGIVFGDRVSRLNLEIASKKAKKLGYNYNIGDLI
jgi:peptide deformylase